MQPSDWPQVAAIYADGIATGRATFETEVPAYSAWDEAHLATPRVVARAGDRIAGWAALAPVSRRPVYAGVADVSVYVAAGGRGRGGGRRLHEELIRRSEAAGSWTLQAGIFPENEASLWLHRSCGFREVGLRERIGRHGGVWRDVLLLERRSRRAGCENDAP